MKTWTGSRNGTNQWETYTDEIRNFPIKIIHSLDIPEYQQIFYVRFRDINSGQEVLTGSNHFFDGETGPKFYITSFDPNQFVIELRPKLDDGMFEYIIELKEEEADQLITVSTGGSTDSTGFSLSYRFDFGDGTITEWSTTAESSHLYEDAGVYKIKSQSSAPGLTSYWSDPLTVTVYDTSLVVPAPPILEGDARVQLGLMSSYQISGNPVLDGSMNFRVDWDDGTVSDWTQYNSFSHTWKDEGTYNITCQAKSVDGFQKVSNWSTHYQVRVESQYYLIQELERARFVVDSTIRKTGSPTFTPLIVKDSTLAITVPIPFTLVGELVEYKVNFGNGVISNFQSSNLFSHKYSYVGSYGITACLRRKILVDYIFQWVEYEWSDVSNVQVKERIVSIPSAPVPIDGVAEIKCRRKGVITHEPSGESFFTTLGKKWISGYIDCPGLGKFLVSHGVNEYPYLVFIDFDLEGDKNIRSVEKRYSIKGNELLADTSIIIKQQLGGKIPVVFNKYIESIILDSLGIEQEVITSRYKVLVRS